MFLITLCSLLVGFLCGATSVGGVLLIPAIVYCLKMDIHLAAGTALCSFFFTAIFGTWLHWRMGRLRRAYALPMGAGGLIFGCLGAVASSAASSGSLRIVLACIIILSGMAAWKPICSRTERAVKGERNLLFGVGAFVGFAAGLTGVGGPVLSVPIMMALGFDPLLSVAGALPLQLACCFSGSIGNLLLGQIDGFLVVLTVVMQIAGFYAGGRAAERIDTSFLRTCVSLLCIGTGMLMLWG